MLGHFTLHIMKHFSILLLGLTLSMAGCAHIQPSVTGSSAPFSVRWDIAHMVAYLDADKSPDCKERRQITVEPLPSDKLGTTVERWRVERCGTVKFYHITFTPTPAIGGYDYSVKAEE
jgi:hypothetical protein